MEKSSVNKRKSNKSVDELLNKIDKTQEKERALIKNVNQSDDEDLNDIFENIYKELNSVPKTRATKKVSKKIEEPTVTKKSSESKKNIKKSLESENDTVAKKKSSVSAKNKVKKIEDNNEKAVKSAKIDNLNQTTKMKSAEVSDVKKTTRKKVSKADEDIKALKSKSEKSVAKSKNAKDLNDEQEKNKTKKSTPKSTSNVSKTATGVKKKITEEIEKATSEKSGQIKIKQKNSEGTIEDKKRATKVKSKSTTMPRKKSIKPKEEIVEEYDKDINIDFVEDELQRKFDINKFDKELKNRKYIPMKDKKSIFYNSFYNMILAGICILFLVFCNYGFYNIEKNTMIKNLNLFSFVFLGISLMLIESSYKKEKINNCINGIETLIMGIFTLFLTYILQIYTTQYVKLLKISGSIVFVYYLVKSIIVYISKRNKYIRSKDDISKDDGEKSELEEDYDDEFDD